MLLKFDRKHSFEAFFTFVTLEFLFCFCFLTSPGTFSLLQCTKILLVRLKLLFDHTFCSKPDTEVGHSRLQVADGNGAECGETEWCDVPGITVKYFSQKNLCFDEYSDALMYFGLLWCILGCFDVYFVDQGLQLRTQTLDLRNKCIILWFITGRWLFTTTCLGHKH